MRIMPWHKRLRWRLIAPQFLVVFVGVGIMVVATGLILRAAPALIRPFLAELAADSGLINVTEAGIVRTFRNAILLSVLIAAILALIAGIVSAFTLWRIIIAPLHGVAASSRRVAEGRYGERVAVPAESGQSMAQLVVSFNQMAEALERTEQQRVALLSNVSHELRTPLTSLRGYVEGMLDGLFPANEETLAWMSRETDRLQRLVNDIQRLSRIEAGQIGLNLQALDIAALARQVMVGLQGQAQGKQLTLRLEATATPPVSADADRVIQVLTNVVGNAIRYTPEGGRIVITVRPSGNVAEVAVRDSGIGIPAEALPYVFERFYRVDSSRARRSGGTGIGLSIARHLVWAMGGELTAVSPGEGQGATFTFTLPLAEAAPPAVEGR